MLRILPLTDVFGEHPGFFPSVREHSWPIRLSKLALYDLIGHAVRAVFDDPTRVVQDKIKFTFQASIYIIGL